MHSHRFLASQVTEHALAGGDEVTAVLAFETFLDLLEVPASWMSAFLPALVKLSVESACNIQLELNTREQALQASYNPCNGVRVFAHIPNDASYDVHAWVSSL